jgi:hypothetical protein
VALSPRDAGFVTALAVPDPTFEALAPADPIVDLSQAGATSA